MSCFHLESSLSGHMYDHTCDHTCGLIFNRHCFILERMCTFAGLRTLRTSARNVSDCLTACSSGFGTLLHPDAMGSGGHFVAYLCDVKAQRYGTDSVILVRVEIITDATTVLATPS